MIRKLETLAAAVGFAEGGDFDTARELMADLGRRYTTRRRKIVLASSDLPLQPEPMEYAIGLASRLKYDTLFLNILSGRGAKENTIQDLVDGSKRLFQELAARSWPTQRPDIACEHAVLQGDFRLMLREACRMVGGVELVIVQSRKGKPCLKGLQVPVFCFDM